MGPHVFMLAAFLLLAVYEMGKVVGKLIKNRKNKREGKPLLFTENRDGEESRKDKY